MEAPEASVFSLSGVRERMREKRNGALRTAKLNASLASKIKTKIINNSSTIKVSLKHNNKALALALNAQKANAQRLTQEKAVLQKEVEQCHFQNAVLRHKLSFLNNILKKLENLMSAVKTAQLSEFHTSFESLSNGQKSNGTEDSWDNDIPDGLLERAAGMPMRVPISKLPDAGQQSANSKAVQTSSVDLQGSTSSNEPLEIVPVVFKDTLPPQPAGKPQPHQEENGEKPAESMEARKDFMDSFIFGEIRPLQDLTNGSSCSEEVSVRASRRRKEPVCYAEPKIHSKLRQGDPFTDTMFLYVPLHKTKRTAKANKMTSEIKEEKT
ncbi:shugoshin 2 isoform X2 [Calypte anna]|uniref:shugoshin 2 isoform X2 n=1 Tax=Calypte anna TaxID=9244 RepID=UPI0011C3B73D|nr:shugoshin 2 isoform X2 [Calypte anna]